MIIDGHVQFGPGLRTDSPLQPVIKAATAGELIAILDRAGIDRAVVHAPRWLGGTAEDDFIDPNYELANAAIADAVRRNPTRLTGFARVNPKFGSRAVAELEKCLTTYGFRGLFVDNAGDGLSYADTKLFGPLLELCAAHAAPVLAYTWIAPSQPFQLVTLARSFAGVNFIMAHSGWRLSGDASIAAENAANLYFDTSFGNAGVARFANKRFGERVVFGSNIPYGIPEIELQRVRRWGQLSDAQLALVLGGNMARLIGLQA